MKHLLLYAGIAFIGYSVLKNRTSQQSNPTVDTAGTTVATGVSAALPTPGNASAGGSAPAASSTGSLPVGSLGSDKPSSAAPQAPSPDAVSSRSYNDAFERHQFGSPVQYER